MYQALLTNRYLTSRVIPLIAVAAVALCVALVIIVVSVMTGFLDMVKSSGRTLMGDVVVSYSVSGIPHYERLIERINALPEAHAATPVVDFFALLRMPYPDGRDKMAEPVNVWGIEPSFAEVTGYRDTIHWKEVSDDQWRRLLRAAVQKHWRDLLESMDDQQRIKALGEAIALDGQGMPDEAELRTRLQITSDEQWETVFLMLSRNPPLLQQVLSGQQWSSLLAKDPRLIDRDAIFEEALTLQHAGDDRVIILGMHVSELNQRQRDGTYQPLGLGYWWMPLHQLALTTIPAAGGTLNADKAETRLLQVVNEFVSGVYLIDDKRVMIPLPIAQSMTHLDEGEIIDPDDPTRVLGVSPKRATMVLVRAADGVTPTALQAVVEREYRRFHAEIAAREDAVTPPLPEDGLSIKTWLQQQQQFIGPVEKEREMMRTLFSLVYIVCAGLVLAIFWAIVYEKTRDIGILRSVGASRLGISWIFLRYGLVVGILGSVLGLGLAYLIVHNINVIHETLGYPPLWLARIILGLAGVALIITIVRSFSGRLLPVVLGSLITVALGVLGGLALWLWNIGGVLIWDPAVYYFTKIPNHVDVNSAYITMIGAVVFSLIGAFVPAAKAADTDPVAALRYE